MQVLLYTIVVVATFFFMEFVAWFTHKYVMHGFLWVLHRDHHQAHDKAFEKNDAFFVIFAVPSCLFFVLGARAEFDVRFWMGLGIALYGATYFLIHDWLIHQRLPWPLRSRLTYLRAIQKAHSMHHQPAQGRGECYGMLFFPYKYYRAAKLEQLV